MSVAWDRIAPLREVDPMLVESFSCGETEMDDWFVHKSIQWGELGRCGTHVALGGGRIVGFFSLAAVELRAMDMPKKERHGKSRINFPAILLGQIAVSRDFRGKGGVGGSLLHHAMRKAFDASCDVGGSFMVLDPLNDGLAGWYGRFGFKEIPGGSGRMFLPMKTVRSIVEGLGEGYFVF